MSGPTGPRSPPPHRTATIVSMGFPASLFVRAVTTSGPFVICGIRHKNRTFVVYSLIRCLSLSLSLSVYFRTYIHTPLCFLRLRRRLIFMFVMLLTFLSLSLSSPPFACLRLHPCLTVFLLFLRSFNNFANKSSEELKDLLLTAITEQKRQLRASVRSSNGETGILARRSSSPSSTKKKETSNPTDTALTELYKWVQKVNAKKADKEAAKMLQAKGLVLSSS